MEKQLELIRKIEKEFKEIIRSSFPNNFVRSWGSSGLHFHANFATENKYFQTTEYKYDNGSTFFHLTNYRNLFSILNSRVIRMYNLHNSNDPEEYDYSANLLNSTVDEIKFRKDNIYTFSFCPIDELQNEQVWAKYGSTFSGIAIVFEIVNDASHWDNFHISGIKYNLSPSLKHYVNEIRNLKEKYSGSTFYLELEKIMAFHKRESWENEKEVRILTYNPFKSWEERLKFSKIELKIEENRNRLTEYIDLDLWVDNESTYLQNKNGDPLVERRQINLANTYFEKRPKIIIKDILFGYKCGLSDQDYIKFKEEIERLIKFNFGYHVKMNNLLFKIQ